ncbi:MAG: hypothetical protein QXJ32_04790 [Thermoplasmata archaeon]
MRLRTVMAAAVVLAMMSVGLNVVSWEARAVQGPEDPYGYSYIDSNAPGPSIAFDWVEINATGTKTDLRYYYEYRGPLPIGFDFAFYGNIYSEFYVTTNGYISFGYGDWEYLNDPIPDSWYPNNIIAAYWDRLSNAYGSIYYETIGSYPTRQLVVEWENVTDYAGNHYMTFEIVLKETGDILIQYLKLDGMDGSGATVGIEDEDGLVGTQYSYNTPSLSDGLAILFTEGPMSIGPDRDGMGRPGDTVFYTLSVVNRQPFTDSFDIAHSSVEGWSVSFYDSAMGTLTDTNGNSLPDTGPVSPNSSFTLIVGVDVAYSTVQVTETTTLVAYSYLDPAVFDTCIVTTKMVGAWFTPPHTDHGQDINSDGAYDRLVVDASVYVNVADWYYVHAVLYTPTGTYLWSASSYLSTGAGAQTCSVAFRGWPINEAGEDGPYRVELTMYDSAWDIISTDTHYTAAYSASAFMLIPGEFVLPFSDTGVDTDSDGLYDYLAVDVVIDANYDFPFRVDGTLYDDNWAYITYEEVTTDLDAGLRTVRVLFDAREISEFGTVSGPFHAYFSLYVLESGSWTYLSSASYDTSSYDLALFEVAEAVFLPPHSDYTTDPDMDGLYDYLVVRVGVDVRTEGDYTVIGVLRADSWADVIDTQTNTTHMSAGAQWVELWYHGWPIRYNADSDDMDVELELRQDGTVLDTDWYTTPTYYRYYWFEDAPGWLEPPYGEAPLDNDSDGLYDYLVVDIPVNVTLAGTYQVEAELLRTWSIDVVVNATYLEPGTTIVQVKFTGWVIRQSGRDGPYTVSISLYDSRLRLMDTDAFNTAAYTSSQFESLPAQFGSPHEAYAQDTDGDGDLDGMFVNATVEVSTAGIFAVHALLQDSMGYTVCTAGVTVSLDVGTRVVNLRLPAWQIRTHAVSGDMWILLYLYDDRGERLDHDSISAYVADYRDFDGTVPRITSAWAVTAPSVDGVFSPGEWDGAASVEMFKRDVTSGPDATLMVMNDGSYLYILYDVHGDPTDDEYDASAVAFDTGNDDVGTPGHEDEFMMTCEGFSSQWHMTYLSSSGWYLHCEPFDHLGLSGAFGYCSSPGHPIPHRIFEYRIPLALLGVEPGDILGFLAGSHSYPGVRDGGSWDAAWWPAYIYSAPGLELYGELQLAQLVIVLPVTAASISGTAGSAGWYKSSVDVTLWATAGTYGVDRTEYTIDGGAWQVYSSPFQVAGDGTHSIEYRSVDVAGHTEETKILQVRIDTVAPVTQGEVSGANVWLNATDATSGLGQTYYRVDGGGWAVYSGMIAVSGAGSHTVEFYSVDVAGNTEAVKTLQVEVEENDGQGGGGLSLGGLSIWMVLVIAAAIAIVSIGVILAIKRRAKDSESKAATSDVGSPKAGMIEEGVPPPPDELPPPPQSG